MPEPTPPSVGLIVNVGQTARTKTKARDRRTLGHMTEASSDRDDSAAIADAIRRELSLGVGFTRFASGSVPVFAVGDEYVVKLFPAAERAFFNTETAALTRIDRGLSIPTPHLVAAGERSQWLYVVMTRLSGCSLAEAWQAIGTHDRRELISQVGVALAELHAVTTDGLTPLTVDWPCFVDAQRASCRERQLAKGLGDPWVDLLDEFLATWTPADDGARALLHTLSLIHI